MNYQAAVLIGAIGLAASGSVGSLGSSMESTVAGASSTEPGATPKLASGAEAALGSIAKFGSGTVVLLEQAQKTVRRAADAVNTLDALPGPTAPYSVPVSSHLNWLTRSAARWDSHKVGRVLAADYLPENGLRPAAEALAPNPGQWTQIMRWMSESYRTGDSSADLRKAYDTALRQTIPEQLQAMRRGYIKALAVYGSDFDVGMERNPLLVYRAMDDVQAQVAILGAKQEISATEVADLAHALNFAQTGHKPLKTNRKFTPIFSDSLIPASPDDFVDALVTARALRSEGKPVLFPHEFPPSGSVMVNARNAETAGNLSHAVTSFFDEADRHTTLPDLWPEGIRRRRFVRAIFPERPFNEIGALEPDHRVLAAALYQRVLRPSAARNKSKFRSSFRLHQRIQPWHLGSEALRDSLLNTIGNPLP